VRHALRLAVLLTALLGSLLLASCGGSSHTQTVTVARSAAPPANASAPQQPGKALLAHQCPAGESYMGCSVLPSANMKGASSPLRGAGQALFPDVSVWQGHVDWGTVAAWQRSHGWPTGGIFKMGEYSIDSQAASNAAGTRSLSWRGGYWFVRNTGCQHEAGQIVSAARAYGLKVVWLDAEVPEASGYGQCLSPPLKKAGLLVGEYTSPGTNPGGLDTSDPLWQATYGSSFSPVWHPVVAWQCTDGTFGCRTFVPGIGFDDVSIDLGISKLTGPPVVDPYAKYDKTVRTFAGGVKASEYNTVKTWDAHTCKDPPRRIVCKTSHAHLVLLLGRLNYLAGHKLVRGHWVVVKPSNWKPNNLGSRAAGIRGRL
jgi:hypothetical protein